MCDDSSSLYDTRTARNILRDLVPCEAFHDISRDLGFIPASAEVEKAEHVQSHMRRDAVTPLTPLIARLSDSAAQMMSGVQTLADGHGCPERDAAFVAVSRGAALSVITQLVDHGYLEVRP